MKDFNENPFKANTPVIPFSNGSEADHWQENNCHKCIKYEDESTNSDEAKCDIAYELDLGRICGDVPLWAVAKAGCDYNPLYQTCRLYDNCRKFSDGKGFF